MADRTGIEWTDASWQVTHGCGLVSPGCTNCYAMRLAARLERMGNPAYADLTLPSKAGAVWSGEVREADLGDLPQPLRWRKPRRIFVNSMSDLFHDAVSSVHIAHVFGIMACAQQHTFQVLTKRPLRMRYLLNDPGFWEVANSFCSGYALNLSDPLARRSDDYRSTARDGAPDEPLPNVWLGVSIEDQWRALERLISLRGTPAAVRFLSLEPLIGRLRVRDICRGMDWVIVGGESGPGHRNMRPEWALELLSECRHNGVAFFMKQMAGRAAIPPELMVREFP